MDHAGRRHLPLARWPNFSQMDQTFSDGRIVMGAFQYLAISGAAALSMFLGFPAWASDGKEKSVGDAVKVLNPSEVGPQQDYPVSSWRAGEEGRVTVKLTTDANGTLLDCQLSVSSGYKALDDQTCASVRLHGKFQVSGQPNEPDGRFSSTIRMLWLMPTGGPRALFLGVTFTDSKPALNQRLRCAFSDGRVLFVPQGSSCVLVPPMQTITAAGTTCSVDIVDYYRYLYGRDHQAAYAFNVAVILATYQYAQSLDYLRQASDDGLGLASAAMCGAYASPHNYYRDLYDPKEAVCLCLLADRQGLSLGLILAQQLLITHPDAADADQRQYIKTHPSAMPVQTSGAVLTTPGNELIKTQDYPKDALKQKIQGRTVALFKVNDRGRVEDCLIIQSSLSFSLDETVCRRLGDAAIYTPATLFGQPTASWQTQSVSWQIGKNSNGFGSTIFGALAGVLIGHAIP